MRQVARKASRTHKAKSKPIMLEADSTDSTEILRNKIVYAGQPMTPMLGRMILEASEKYGLTPAQVLDVAMQADRAVAKMLEGK